MRIAVAGLHTESSTGNPVLTGAGDFRQLRGAGLMADPYFAFLADYPATFLPLLHARALPGGPVEAGAWQAFTAEILQGLAGLLPLRGVYLAMHGAVHVQGAEDAEGAFLAQVRALVGPDCLIAASYDLHGNLSQPVIDALDIFSTYRTAPHIDVEATMRRAVGMLVRALTTGERPGLIWAPVPALFAGEMSSTEDEPARSFYAGLAAHEGGGVWDASFQVGYVWADEPRATAAAVVTGTDRRAMAGVAARLAQGWWDRRHDFRFGMPTAPLAATLDRALAAGTRPVILADSGDNPTGGGVGDRADVLAALLARDRGPTRILIAGIADEPATAAAYTAGHGARLTCPIGATLAGAGPRPVITAEVMFLAPAARPGDRQAVLRTGGLTLVTTARRRPFHHIADFASLGLPPRDFDLIVVKSGYLSPELAPLANPGLMALTDGAVPQAIASLPNRRRARPMFPFDGDFDWGPVPR